jgi:hypothetical protein
VMNPNPRSTFLLMVPSAIFLLSYASHVRAGR